MGILDMSVSIKDIAKATGYSPMTVSLSLNPRKSSVRVSKETQAKIQAYARKLGYKPDALARSLKMGSSNVVGVMFCTSGDEFYWELQTCIDRELRAHGLLGFYTYWGTLEEFDASLEAMRQYRVCGILTGHDLPADYNRGVPALCYGTRNDFLESIYPDEFGLVECAVRHAVSRGYQRIGYLGYDYIERSRFFPEAVRAHGLEPACCHLGPAQSNLGALGAERLLNTPLPEVLICDRDHTAFQVMSELQSHGVAVPKDIAVIGINNTRFCEMTTPRLTTVDLRIPALASKLVNRLIYLCDHPGTPRQDEKFECAIIERDSCPAKEKT